MEDREISLDEIKARGDFKEKFTKRVCCVFKDYIKQGMPKKEAITATNNKLKKEFSICAYHLVQEELSRNGIFKDLKQ